ncbi:MAG: D-alanyl-D-alanine carboxypeptidase, partial [Oscillospiraceae bacterium]|nr:D-alanyl-D-alanine carboxypeptidase [Oscillospiraceae bacterium]
INTYAETDSSKSLQDLPAKSYFLMEMSTGQVLKENNADEKMPPASITKIMTMLLLMERIDLGEISMDDMVKTSEHANSMGGTQIWLEIGEQMSVADLLKATAVNSANDAAVAIAEYIAGTEDQFAELMNQRAQELGMKNTHFCNASGLDADGHLSTARDIAIMSKELLKHPTITKYTSIYMDSLRGGKTELVNTNKMVRFYEGCNGLKTGTTDDAGSCLSCSAVRDKMTLIAVSMGSANSKDRFNTCRSLLDYGFSSWSLVTPAIEDSEKHSINIINGQKDTAKVETDSDNSAMLLPKGSASKIEKKIEMEESIEAPIEKGRCVGKISYMLNDKEISSQNLIVTEDVPSINFSFTLLSMVKNFFGGVKIE